MFSQNWIQKYHPSGKCGKAISRYTRNRAGPSPGNRWRQWFCLSSLGKGWRSFWSYFCHYFWPVPNNLTVFELMYLEKVKCSELLIKERGRDGECNTHCIYHDWWGQRQLAGRWGTGQSRDLGASEMGNAPALEDFIYVALTRLTLLPEGNHDWNGQWLFFSNWLKFPDRWEILL